MHIQNLVKRLRWRLKAKSFLLYVWEGFNYDAEFFSWSLESEEIIPAKLKELWFVGKSFRQNN